MEQAPRQFRARMCGQLIEPLEELELPQDQEFMVALSPLHGKTDADVLSALRDSAGAWSAANHPELSSREDVVALVSHLRRGFDRGYGE
jgi:hypothetical protein